MNNVKDTKMHPGEYIPARDVGSWEGLQGGCG